MNISHDEYRESDIQAFIHLYACNICSYVRYVQHRCSHVGGVHKLDMLRTSVIIFEMFACHVFL